jgi:MFS family permease
MAAVVQTCDVGVIRSTRISAPCRPSSRPWVIAATSLGSGMAFLDSTVLNVALPVVQAYLGASAREAQWVYGAYALVLSALVLIGGSLGDRYGRRRVFVLGDSVPRQRPRPSLERRLRSVLMSFGSSPERTPQKRSK